MVSNLTANRRGSEDVDAILNEAADKCQEIKQNLVKAVDADTDAFNEYMDARRMPAATDEDLEKRNAAMLLGLKNAVKVPLHTAEESAKAIEIAEVVAKNGNPNSITDVGVGAQMAYSGVLGGIYNVLINLKDINDEEFCTEMRTRCDQIKMDSQHKLVEVLKYVEERLK
jgi:glutamate formiminotransferase/formiminotetrahydrofolate cyclodeaminase